MQKYNFKEVEKNKQKFWKENNFFSDHNNTKKSFSILMPPPNITGKLHLGHGGDLTIQDSLIRFYKLLNYDVLFIPGLDHAGIATQIKVEKEIETKFNLNPKEVSKQFLLNCIDEWKQKQSALIIQQWDKLGASVDLNYLLFTLSSKVQTQINKIFVYFYNQNLIYQDQRIIFWDVKLKTALSNIEVTYQNQTSNLYYIKYYFQDLKNYLIVATTRPETIFVDQAIFINNKDERYLKYLNKKVINPLTKAKLKILKDSYVDSSFGSGVLKCTPAHDQNDFLLAKKHNLKIISCIDFEGKINKNGLTYQGLNRFKAREQIIANLKKENLIVKIEKIKNKIPFNSRSNTILEPLISKQWFFALKKVCTPSFVQELKQTMFANLKNQSLIKPYKFSKLFFNWIRDIDDWCISRQISWGHHLPIYEHKITKKIIVSEIEPNLNEYTKSNDVLDTWFSSGLWALLTLNFDFDTKAIQNRYFPISCLVTGYDIIFFWVAKMIIFSLLLKKQLPFKKILIHGIIRDKNNLKMSKSRNNGVDPLVLIDKYGADSLRLYLILYFSSGIDLKFNENLIKLANINLNKIYQCFNYLNKNIDFKNIEIKNLNINKIQNKFNLWILNEFKVINNNFINEFKNYNLKNAAFILLTFFKDVFCNKYLEVSKILLLELNLKCETQSVLFFLFKKILILFHPFIPFLSEHLYQKLNLKTSILQEEITVFSNLKQQNFNNIKNLWTLIFKIRQFKQNYNINSFFKINILTNQKLDFNLNWYNKFLLKLANCQIKNLIINQKEITYFSVNFFNQNRIEFLIPNIEINKIKNQIKKEYLFVHQEIKRCQKLLANKHFLKNANLEKIELEKNKLATFEKNLVELEKNITNLKIEI